MDANRDLRDNQGSTYGVEGDPDVNFGLMPNNAPTQNSPTLNRYGGNRGIITTRPSRDSIVRSYSEQAAARARNARMASQKTYHDYQVNSMREQQRRQRREAIRAQNASSAQSDASKATDGAEASFERTARGGIAEPRSTQRQHMGRAIRPLTSEESRQYARQSKESYERERASRDALSDRRIMRSPNREVIDARGSVDSRAFNELDELVGYSIDDRDRPAPFVDSASSGPRWKSHAGQGFDGTRDRSAAPARPSAHASRINLSSLSDTISGRDSYGNPKSGFAGLPFLVKAVIPVIIILIVILLFILL